MRRNVKKIYFALMLILVRIPILCQVYFIESTIAQLFSQVIQRGQLTLKDRCVLMTAILNNSLCQEEEILINRLLHSVRRGRLQVIDE
ncbi:hypothetical protein [Allocoleopsis sp.]|uniref:hypothetical protein n=1 Tax=Allocoleopsis sp. TaxID=3088169 RepID=UPI002FD0C33B